MDLGVYTTVFNFESHWIKFQGDIIIGIRSWPLVLPVMPHGELLQLNNAFFMGGGWFKTQGMKGETGFSAWKWSVLVKTTRLVDFSTRTGAILNLVVLTSRSSTDYFQAENPVLHLHSLGFEPPSSHRKCIISLQVFTL